MMTFTFDAAASIDLTSIETFVVESTVASLSEEGRLVPASIPASQRYFWTARWQAGEAESRRDIANGEVEQFDDPLDAIRWLLSEEG